MVLPLASPERMHGAWTNAMAGSPELRRAAREEHGNAKNAGNAFAPDEAIHDDLSLPPQLAEKTAQAWKIINKKLSHHKKRPISIDEERSALAVIYLDSRLKGKATPKSFKWQDLHKLMKAMMTIISANPCRNFSKPQAQKLKKALQLFTPENLRPILAFHHEIDRMDMNDNIHPQKKTIDFSFTGKWGRSKNHNGRPAKIGRFLLEAALATKDPILAAQCLAKLQDLVESFSDTSSAGPLFYFLIQQSNALFTKNEDEKATYFLMTALHVGEISRRHHRFIFPPERPIDIALRLARPHLESILPHLERRDPHDMIWQGTVDENPFAKNYWLHPHESSQTSTPQKIMHLRRQLVAVKTTAKRHPTNYDRHRELGQTGFDAPFRDFPFFIFDSMMNER